MKTGRLFTGNERQVKRGTGDAAPALPPCASKAPAAAAQSLHKPRAMLKTVRRGTLALVGVALSAFAASPVAAQPSRGGAPLPELPANGGSDSPTPAQALDPASDSAPAAAPRQAAPPDTAAPQLTPRQLYEHVRRGVVVVERNGAPSAIGTVLGGDGRILTALSGLGGSEGPDVRYADGTRVHAKVVYSDKALDLALLAPDAAGSTSAGRRTEGLAASEMDPAAAEIRAMLPGGGMHLGPAFAALKGRVDAHSQSGAALMRMLDVGVQGAPVAGAPLLDPTGDVVAVLVRACKGPPPAAPAAPTLGAWPQVAPPASSPRDGACQPTVIGAPVSQVRAFLAEAMRAAAAMPSSAPTPAAAVPAAPATAPWLGIRGESERAGAGGVRGVRVVDVAAGSPAAKAGLTAAGDVIVAVDGQSIDSPEKLGESIGKHAIGDSVKLLVFNGSQFREINVVLRPAP